VQLSRTWKRSPLESLEAVFRRADEGRIRAEFSKNAVPISVIIESWNNHVRRHYVSVDNAHVYFTLKALSEYTTIEISPDDVAEKTKICGYIVALNNKDDARHVFVDPDRGITCYDLLINSDFDNNLISF